MRKDLGAKEYIVPMPVLIISTYNEDNTANAMNAAWGCIYDYKEVFISMSDHKTTDNLAKTNAFVINIPSVSETVESDYFGVVSGRDVNDKIGSVNMTVTRSNYVNAPIINEYKLALECEVKSFENGNLIGRILNVNADESILTDGKIDLSKFNPILFDPTSASYWSIGEKVGQAFKDGFTLKK